jgi:AcrR family transcriptional regulator
MTSLTQTAPERLPVGRVLRADARRNREAVIAAAKKLFADQGLDAQMPDIAKAAKVGVGTVYRHFPTKDDLIAALAVERFERLAEKVREALEQDDPWDGLCEFIRFAARLQADDRGLCEVMGSRPEVMNASALAV